MKSLAKTGRRRRRPTLQNGTVPPLWRLDRIQDFPRSGVARGLGARKRRKLDPVARDEAQCSGVRPIKRAALDNVAANTRRVSVHELLMMRKTEIALAPPC
jgi:hypothetical protein